uniref:DUF3489 domain-containing protein n=1 Tax=Altererythrobacter segetis TaxID=1104773 RepID=UPI001407B30A|nr:DUF3489 domain-containing protein [Altererythrobacter segetis]
MAGKPTRRFARTRANTDKSTEANVVAAKSDAPAIPKAHTKISKVLMLLNREEGATVTEIVTATGWLPHTTRAALTALKKKGHTVTSTKTDGVRTYRILMAPRIETEASTASESTPDA